MKNILIISLLTFVPCFGWSQSAIVDVSLSPAGSFKINISEVKGFAEKSDDSFVAKNVVVSLKNLKTGIGLRDVHTKKQLEIEKYPEAVLISATGKNGIGEGLIRIKDVEKKIEGTYKIVGKSLLANFKIKYQDFKIAKAKYMGIGVKDAVQLTVRLPIRIASKVQK